MMRCNSDGHLEASIYLIDDENNPALVPLTEPISYISTAPCLKMELVLTRRKT